MFPDFSPEEVHFQSHWGRHWLAGRGYLKLTPPVVWIFKFNGEWVLLAALHLCKSFVMWLRADNCTLNILFVLQLVLTRWPPIYDPVYRCTVCTVSTVPVRWLGPVPQSATNTRAVQISAKISVERSITYLWWFQDDFNRGKEKWLCQVTLDQCVIQFEWSLRGLYR